MKYAQLGSIGTGTLRTEDLLDAFSRELEYHVQRNADEWLGEDGRNACRQYTDMVWEAREVEDFESEEAVEILEQLSRYLEEFAPPYCYFGALEGDGADIGFWFCGMDAVEDLQRISDPSEVENHLGEECVLVNDHGNITVYGANGEPILELI